MPHAAAPSSAASLLAVALAAGAGTAGATEASFDFTIAGIRVGDDDRSAPTQTGNSYAATAPDRHRGRDRHVRGLLLRRQRHGHGRPATAPWCRCASRATSKSPRGAATQPIDWKDGTPVTVSVEPPRIERARPGRPGAARSTRSRPAFACSCATRRREDICDTVVDVFDGSRRSRLALDPPSRRRRSADLRRPLRPGRGRGEQHRRPARVPVQLVFRRNGDGVGRNCSASRRRTNFGTAVIERRG